ncbi:alanine--tRNA ligase [Candidatus Parcubacteria bacterium]|nr:alanine--tRNA ligase [Candidatus Parcubacteria bacterium]
MTSMELRKEFLDFFESKGHKIVPSSSLLPSDPSVLLTTAGMQQFKEYFIGQKDPQKDFGAKKIATCQKCFRVKDINDVSDASHHTFFEMLGNFSFNDYFKKEAIEFAWEFLTTKLRLDPERLHITIFEGNELVPKDEEAKKIWLEKIGIRQERIKEFGMKDNFWGPVSGAGPCGPGSEIHYDNGQEFSKNKCTIKGCGPNCECGRFVEIWNLVFTEYDKQLARDGEYEYKQLKYKNIDTGMGFERVLAILQNKPSAYETDIFFPIIQQIDKQIAGLYDVNPKPYRIIADHIRGACFLIADGIVPSNLDKGYILRRILRRAIRYGRVLNLSSDFLIPLARKVIEGYKDIYPELGDEQDNIISVIQGEEEKFNKTLEKGLKQFGKLISKISVEQTGNSKIISGEDAFTLYQSYGFPIELTKELAKEEGFEIDEKDFRRALVEHQDISRAGVEKKFGGHGIEGSKIKNDKIIKLHTATHLLHSALRQILGNEIRQMGSNINEERLRFDFSFDRKMSVQEIKQTQDLVNQKISENLEVKKQKMEYKQAIIQGALAFFKEKYPDIVTVYSIGDFSKEICAGPHVEKTGEIGKFKIIKEQSSSAGIRRIKATIE